MDIFKTISSLIVISTSSRKGSKGQTLVEYVLLLVLIAIGILLATTFLGTQTCNLYSRVANSVP